MGILAHVMKLVIFFCYMFQNQWFTNGQLQNKAAKMTETVTFSTSRSLTNNKWWFQQLQSEPRIDICAELTGVSCPLTPTTSSLVIEASSSFAGIIKYEFATSNYSGASLIVLDTFKLTNMPNCVSRNETHQLSAEATYYKTPNHGNSPVISFKLNNVDLSSICSFGNSGINHNTTCTATINNSMEMDNAVLTYKVYFNSSSWNIATEPNVLYASDIPTFEWSITTNIPSCDCVDDGTCPSCSCVCKAFTAAFLAVIIPLAIFDTIGAVLLIQSKTLKNLDQTYVTGFLIGTLVFVIVLFVAVFVAIIITCDCVFCTETALIVVCVIAAILIVGGIIIGILIWKRRLRTEPVKQ